MHMHISVESLDDLTIIKLSGRLDAKSAPDVDAEIAPYIYEGCRILFDMQEVGYMSSAGLRTLLLLHRHVDEHKGRVALVGVSERLQDTMMVTGFIQHFDLYQNRDEGMASLRQ